MKLRSFKRGIGDGIRNVFRNGRMSFASIGTITICLIVLGINFVLLWNVQSFTTQIDDNLSVVVFMKEGIEETEIKSLMSKIRQRDEVERVAYTSAEQAWADFQREMEENGTIDPDLMSYVEDNPLKNSASLTVFLKSAGRQASLVEYLDTLPEVRKLNFSGETSKVLTALSNTVTVVGAAMIVLLIVVSVILISNTVRLSVYMRRDEIAIMKYLGATNAFVELPFVVEGIFIGLMGTIIPCLLVYFGYGYILKAIAEHFPEVTSYLSFVPLLDIIKYLFPVYGILSIVVGTLGAQISMKKYLRA